MILPRDLRGHVASFLLPKEVVRWVAAQQKRQINRREPPCTRQVVNRFLPPWATPLPWPLAAQKALNTCLDCDQPVSANPPLGWTEDERDLCLNHFVRRHHRHIWSRYHIMQACGGEPSIPYHIAKLLRSHKPHAKTPTGAHLFWVDAKTQRAIRHNNRKRTRRMLSKSKP